MTQETVRVLSDSELVEVVGWAQEEIRARAEKRKRETIAKIKAMAAEAGVTVTINGVKGRPGQSPANAGLTKQGLGSR